MTIHDVGFYLKTTLWEIRFNRKEAGGAAIEIEKWVNHKAERVTELNNQFSQIEEGFNEELSKLVDKVKEKVPGIIKPARLEKQPAIAKVIRQVNEVEIRYKKDIEAILIKGTNGAVNLEEELKTFIEKHQDTPAYVRDNAALKTDIEFALTNIEMYTPHLKQEIPIAKDFFRKHFKQVTTFLEVNEEKKSSWDFGTFFWKGLNALCNKLSKIGHALSKILPWNHYNAKLG